MVEGEAEVDEAARARGRRRPPAGRGRARSRPCRSPRRWRRPRRGGARKSVMASSRWADQWPKSSGRASRDSNGSPPRVMWSRCHSAEARITGKAAARSRRRMRSASRQSVSKNVGILEQRDLDRLGEAADEVAVGERREQGRVVDDGPGDGERADPVLLAEEVDAVLHADARVGLGERGGRQPDEADAPVGDRRGEPDGVEHRAAADDDDVAPPVEVGGVEDLEHPLEDVDVVLDDLAARDDLHVAGQLDPPGMGRGELAEPVAQVGPGAVDVLVEPELHPRRASLGGLQDAGEDVAVGAEDVVGEVEPVDERRPERDLGAVCGIGRVRHLAGLPRRQEGGTTRPGGFRRGPVGGGSSL